MKQHEYMFRSDKDVFEDGQRVHYIIEVSTNNYECYQELKDNIASIVAQYEYKESQNENQD